ncbi:universal stress protein [Halobacteriales archaeon QH_10_65_19]|jgi:nucleotide-binding universal stress UspA family protein|nr:MAG: universal stress protein [Halobacteriales archaeon QH_10_65_19]
MYRVLMPVDSNETRALAQANYVADLPNVAEEVEVVLLYVFTEKDAESDSRDVTRIASVKRVREYLEKRGIAVRIREDSVERVQSILDHAEEHDVDSLVLGGRKRSPAGKALFGSVTQAVILNTNRPVVVTGGGGD